VFHISSILHCIFILCIIVTNLALCLQDLNKLIYLLIPRHNNEADIAELMLHKL